ncbi:MAG: diguanylate cyclase [Geobacteraceae bacterium]
MRKTMISDEPAAYKPLELLDILRGYPFLEKFDLALFYEKDGVVTRLGTVSPLCGVLARNLVCIEKCEPSFERAVKIALGKQKPMVFSCRAGLMNFAVPYQVADGFRYCFVGGGVRNPTLDLFLMEKLAKSDRIDGFALLEELERLPAAASQEVKDVAKEVSRLLAGLVSDSIQARLLEKNVEMFRTVRGILAHMEGISNPEDLMGFLNETLGILFDIPRVAIAFSDGLGNDVLLRGLIGMVKNLGTCTEKQLAALFPNGESGPVLLPEKLLGEHFPSVVAERALCLPIASGDQLLGLLAIFDDDLKSRDTLLVEMITDRISSKLLQFRAEESHRLEASLAGKFVSVLSTLSLAENRRDLYLSILETAADLLQASSGSLMLIDDNGKNLRIESVLGMSLQLARSMSARVGRGIAGKVAESGEPLLVKDIEQDVRVRIPNRSRFKTKSFISIPLRVKGSVIGVLNLSDKRNGGIFSDADLELLTTVARHACVVLERTEFSEKAAHLEEITLADPLTGLFNRRFLEQRLDEELSRCGRQPQSVTILLVDLDNFKVYNELCGHAAGDVVLKKTARLLKGSARQMDIVTRFGGERFCIILPGTSKKESFCVAERFRREVERAGFTHEENLPLGRLTVSIGIATAPANGNNFQSLLGSADVALHRAKLSGRNRVVHFDSPASANLTTPTAVFRPLGEPKANA